MLKCYINTTTGLQSITVEKKSSLSQKVLKENELKLLTANRYL